MTMTEGIPTAGVALEEVEPCHLGIDELYDLASSEAKCF